LINHPLDCPVCDQSGECFLQDYSYKYGRGVSRFEETKLKQAKKDLGPHVYIYADRCIMCTRCVRFAREIPETAEIMIDGRGNQSQIDVFPGVALDNELSANVIDLCPVGALLDKDFLFAQRVWFLKNTPSIDGITASGDNISIEHNEGKIYRFKPRTNMDVNKWWITDEVRYGWKFVHSDNRLQSPQHRRFGTLVDTDFSRAMEDAIELITERTVNAGKRLMVMVSPMLSCEDAYALATLARSIDEVAILGLGPVPIDGEDKHFPPSAPEDDPKRFTMYAEKAPNERGVRRVLDAINKHRSPSYDTLVKKLKGEADVGAIILTGNYPSAWATDELMEQLITPAVVMIDTLDSRIREVADIVLPSVTWTEKAGTFENANNLLQTFEQAIPVVTNAKSEGQIAADMTALLKGRELDRPSTNYAQVIVDEGPGQVPGATDVISIPRATLFNPANTRQEMAENHPALEVFTTDVRTPKTEAVRETDMEMVEL
ncbi:MAG: molybdopterin-dependent oxidoreductase, partial [Pseudomonadota bacterium]